MNLAQPFSGHSLYPAWFIVSTASLVMACDIEPYLYAYCTLASAAVSLVLLGGAMVVGTGTIRVLGLFSAMPSALACFLLSGIRWG